MFKSTALFIISFLYTVITTGQDISEFKRSDKSKTSPAVTEKVKKSVAKPVKAKVIQKKVDPGPEDTRLDVRFTANANCYLTIDTFSVVEIGPESNFKVKLEPGTYQVTAIGMDNSSDYFQTEIEISKSNNKQLLIPMQDIINKRLREEKIEADRLDAILKEQERERLEQLKLEEAIEEDKRNLAKREEESRLADLEAKRKYQERGDVQAMTEIANGLMNISSTSFTMGNESGSNDEMPEHAVSLSGYSMSQYEVSQSQWERIMGSNPSNFQGCGNCPVENVSWDDVQQFISRLNSLSGNSYRLPTEAEWENAAKGALSEKIGKVSWHFDNAKRTTHPVGSLGSNVYGMYDMFGNVSEWCSDFYEGNYYKNSRSTDPTGPVSGKGRVVRGGSFDDLLGSSPSTSRSKSSQTNRSKTIGFRLVLSN